MDRALIPPDALALICPKCRARFSLQSLAGNKEAQRQEQLKDDPQPAPPVVEQTGASREAQEMDGEEEGVVCEWEKHPSLDTLFRAIPECFLNPRKFFSRLPLAGGYGMPILFYVCVSLVPILAMLVVTLVHEYLGGGLTVQRLLGVLMGFCLTMALGMFFAVLALFVESAIFHAIFRVAKAGKGDLQVTFRMFAYNSAMLFCGMAGNLLMNFPAISARFAATGFVFAGLVYMVSGVVHARHSSPGRAWMACLLLPVLLGILLGLVLSIYRF